MKALPAVLLLLGLAVAHASPRQLLQGDNAATQQAAAAGVGPSTIKRPPVLNCNQPFSRKTRDGLQNAASSARSVNVEPSGAATASAVAGNALTQETAINPDDVSELPGPPKPRFAGRAAFNASDYEQVVLDQPAGGITPSAWCRNPRFWFGGTSLDYSSCALMVPNITSPEGELIVGCSISWFHTPDTRSHIAITAAHCVSLGNDTWLINPSTSIICCAYDPSPTTRNSCPDYATFDINEVRVLNSYHLPPEGQQPLAHDIAVMSTTRSRTGLIPGKWLLNNWDPKARIMSYSVYGYPQHIKNRMEVCNATVNGVNVIDGRRRVYSMRAPVLAHPPSADQPGAVPNNGAKLLGSSCGGSSGGPIQHIQRGGITSVMSQASYACRRDGYGEIWVAAVRGVPWQYGGRPGLTDPNAGVDVWCLKQGL